MVVRAPKIEFVTIVGRIYTDSEGYRGLISLANKFRTCVKKAVRILCKGTDSSQVERILTKEMNAYYAKTIVDYAKFITRESRAPQKAKINKLFIASKGNSREKGNRNIRLLSSNKLVINVNFTHKSSKHDNWIECEVKFGKQYLPLINEVIERALNGEISYTSRIVFKDEGVYLHLSIPIELYIKHFRKGSAKGSNIASFDLNSDRINMIIVDQQGIIRDIKTEWISEVTCPGFPKNKAWALRLNALSRLLKYAYYHGVSIVLFEDLYKIRRKYGRKTGNKNANRKITGFPKRKLLNYGILMALKYGFKVYLVNPAYTSRLGEVLSKPLGLDGHVTSAYMLTLKYLSPRTFEKLLNKDFLSKLLFR